MADAGSAATFENIQKSNEVCVDIGVRIDEGVTNARLPRQMHHVGKSMLGKKRGDAVPIREVEFCESKAVRDAQLFQPRLFQNRIVIRIEVVEGDNPAPL